MAGRRSSASRNCPNGYACYFFEEFAPNRLLDRIPPDIPIAWSRKPTSPEGPVIEIADVAKNISRRIFTVIVK